MKLGGLRSSGIYEDACQTGRARVCNGREEVLALQATERACVGFASKGASAAACMRRARAGKARRAPERDRELALGGVEFEKPWQASEPVEGNEHERDAHVNRHGRAQVRPAEQHVELFVTPERLRTESVRFASVTRTHSRAKRVHARGTRTFAARV